MQMKFIREALERTEDVKMFANPKLSYEEMQTISFCLKKEVDILELGKKIKNL